MIAELQCVTDSHGYRPVAEWKQILRSWNTSHTPKARSLRLLEMIDGWITFLELRESTMPATRRRECDAHLALLFSRLTLHARQPWQTGQARQP